MTSIDILQAGRENVFEVAQRHGSEYWIRHLLRACYNSSQPSVCG